MEFLSWAWNCGPSGDFFFQTPLIRTFPTLLMPLLNSWARGMKKWSKNRACQFRSVRPLKISNPPELIWKPKRISCARKLENQVLPSKKFSRKKIGINFPIFSHKSTVFENLPKNVSFEFLCQKYSLKNLNFRAKMDFLPIWFLTRKFKVFKMRLFGVIFNHCAMKKMKFLMQICIISPVFSPRISSLTHPSSTLLSSRLFCSQPDGFSDCFSICIDEIVEYAHNAAHQWCTLTKGNFELVIGLGFGQQKAAGVKHILCQNTAVKPMPFYRVTFTEFKNGKYSSVKSSESSHLSFFKFDAEFQRIIYKQKIKKFRRNNRKSAHATSRYATSPWRLLFPK